jgi:hypothetical protein
MEQVKELRAVAPVEGTGGDEGGYPPQPTALTKERAMSRNVRPTLEVLEERSNPTTISAYAPALVTVPNLAGDFFALAAQDNNGNIVNGGAPSGRSLYITSETDNHNGTGTFAGYFYDNNNGLVAPVSGTLSFSQQATTGLADGAPTFALAFQGVGGSAFGPTFVSGSGWFITSQVSAYPAQYREQNTSNPEQLQASAPIQWELNFNAQEFGLVAPWTYSFSRNDASNIGLYAAF